MTLINKTLALALSTAVAARATSPAAAQEADRPNPAPVARPAPVRDGIHDFDFLHGTWRVHNRRLRRPLSGSNGWYEFEGRTVERPLWDGQGNLEEYEAGLPDGTRLRGLALRLYDPRAKRWTIHWSSSAKGTLDPPMTGVFRSGRGEFYSHEDYQGRMILVRFFWTSQGPDAARWEQAFSADGGKTWETNWIMEFTRSAGTAVQDAACCPVVELRRYVLHPGMRDTLITLFDREFVETQEAVGMRVIAQFRDIDTPNVFTWLRGFPNMRSRAASLGAFYDGPVWARHKEAANRTMISSDDVRLLRPARPGSSFVLDGNRPGPGATASQPGLVVATIYTLASSSAESFSDLFETRIAPRLIESGARPLAVFETEPAANTFPRLPVRVGDHAFVWFTRFADLTAYDRHVAALAADRSWTREIRPELERHLTAPVEVWRLSPTARSRALH